MDISTINIVYFSATYTTRKIIKLIAGQFKGNKAEYDITQKKQMTDVVFNPDDLLIFGVPVYAGRIPINALESIYHFKGNNTPAIIVCVYGNREYDDALLELKNSVQQSGFKVISAGVFIAQHSIFPVVGQNRPDEKDICIIKEFADKSATLLNTIIDPVSLPDIQVKGNTPYKTPGNIPLKPKGDKKCNECGTCVKVCPVQAIPENTPRKTNKKICISCGRCIVVCSQKARHFSGLLYKLAGRKFIKTNSGRKEPEIVINEF